MDLTYITLERRYELMRLRRDYFAKLASQCHTFKEFIDENDEWLAIVGIELSGGDNEGPDAYISLYIQLDFDDYETYHIVKTPEGRLTCSNIIWWQDDYCANSLRNVVTGESASESDITQKYQPH